MVVPTPTTDPICHFMVTCVGQPQKSLCSATREAVLMVEDNNWRSESIFCPFNSAHHITTSTDSVTRGSGDTATSTNRGQTAVTGLSYSLHQTNTSIHPFIHSFSSRMQIQLHSINTNSGPNPIQNPFRGQNNICLCGRQHQSVGFTSGEAGTVSPFRCPSIRPSVYWW